MSRAGGAAGDLDAPALRDRRPVTLDSWLRRTGFWSLDRLKGGPIRRHVEDIRSS